LNLILEQGDACPAILLGFTVFLLTVVRAREIQGKMLILSKTSTSSAADSPKKGRIRAIQKVCLFHMKVLWSWWYQLFCCWMLELWYS